MIEELLENFGLAEWVADAICDSLIILPFLFVIFVLIELFEFYYSDKVKKYVTKKPHCFNKSNVERTNANLVKILEFVKAVLKILNLN